jgi:electron transfer flavoprotein beta subunit
MNVLVSFKIVPDLDLLSGHDWKVYNSNRVDTRFVKKMINPYDESALELALKLADQAGNAGFSIDLSALTIADSGSDLTLKSLRALGYKKTTRIAEEDDLRFAPEKVAAMITAYARQRGNFDLIFMGRQSGVGDNAKTPLVTAELLGWPCITQVTGVERITARSLQVTAIADEGLVTRAIEPPCLLAVGNAPFSNLRVPTLRAIKEQGERPIDLITMADLKSTLSSLPMKPDADLIKLEPISRKRKSVLIEGSNAVEKAEILYQKFLKGWLAEL